MRMRRGRQNGRALAAFKGGGRGNCGRPSQFDKIMYQYKLVDGRERREDERRTKTHSPPPLPSSTDRQDTFPLRPICPFPQQRPADERKLPRRGVEEGGEGGGGRRRGDANGKWTKLAMRGNGFNLNSGRRRGGE
jgi:hypothetical protein